MKHILILGAGKSATSLIQYVGNLCRLLDWRFTVADANPTSAERKIKNFPQGKAVALDVTKPEQRAALIQTADLVISLLPPGLHIQVARDCIQFKKHLLTASYIDTPLRELSEEIEKAGVLFLCEMGLDPGIDHMSAMEIIHRLKKENARITSFVSHCGGLIAPESDNNPWHYKISWNPRNIILAGSAGATYKKDGAIIQKKYSEIFENCESVDIPNMPHYSWYPNRDSLSYIPIYQLEETDTFIRTTLRHQNFSKGWQWLVTLGLTDPTDGTSIGSCRSYHDWIHIKLKEKNIAHSWSEWLQQQATISPTLQQQLTFLALDSNDPLPTQANSSADILQSILERKLALQPGDKDMILMQHEIAYTTESGKQEMLRSTLVVKGEDDEHTAMAKTVGLPLGIAAKLILNGTLKSTGLKIPIEAAIYEPVLRELAAEGIVFEEKIIPLTNL
ncbi:MAG: saccharopine dehydrogenase NADP-binding domain-containing protein [Bacteroidetes bacterium]|nr:saccharopine dehydrogenase NADP-binding domain-containing protein [Bacteroidota bacterium]